MSSAAMSVSEVLQTRFSVRAFKDIPVPRELLEQIFTLARHAPSNCNVQPCEAYVVSGASKDRLQGELLKDVLSGSAPNPDFEWDVRYQGVHRERQFGSANALYGALGIDRGDKERRQAAMLRNWQFFGAPHAAFFTMEKYLKMTGAVDLGIYAQTLALLLAERGIASCMQGALGMFPDPARRMFGLRDEVASCSACPSAMPTPTPPPTRPVPTGFRWMLRSGFSASKAATTRRAQNRAAVPPLGSMGQGVHARAADPPHAHWKINGCTVLRSLRIRTIHPGSWCCARCRQLHRTGHKGVGCSRYRCKRASPIPVHRAL